MRDAADLHCAPELCGTCHATLTAIFTHLARLKEQLAATERDACRLHALNIGLREYLVKRGHAEGCGVPDTLSVPITDLPQDETVFHAERAPCSCGLDAALARDEPEKAGGGEKGP